MQLLFFVLNRSEMLDDILTSLRITTYTVLPYLTAREWFIFGVSQRRGRGSVFGAMRAFLKPERENSNLIIAAVNDDHVENAVKAIEDVIGDLSKPDTGVVFTVPISYVKGLYKDGN